VLLGDFFRKTQCEFFVFEAQRYALYVFRTLKYARRIPVKCPEKLTKGVQKFESRSLLDPRNRNF